jgi:hypothetical protein
MIPSIDTTVKIEQWRQKAREGTLTLEEAKEAVAYLRGARQAASETAKPSRTHKVKEPPISGDDLLAGF